MYCEKFITFYNFLLCKKVQDKGKALLCVVFLSVIYYKRAVAILLKLRVVNMLSIDAHTHIEQWYIISDTVAIV